MKTKLLNNCNAKHIPCGTRNTNYAVVNGMYVYTCITCGKKDYSNNFQ